MAKKFKGILLDIDNTLYDYKRTHNKTLETVCSHFEKKCSLSKTTLKELYEEARQEIHRELLGSASCHNRLLYFQRMFEKLGISSLMYSLEAYHIYWDTFIGNLNVYAGVYDFLHFIKKRKTCIISDLTADIQHRKIIKMKLFDYVDFLVTSEEAGKEKPHPRIFKLALKKINLKSDEVCMVGDSFQKDIVGAVKLGIHSFWLNTANEKHKPNSLITEFRSFKDLIRKIR